MHTRVCFAFIKNISANLLVIDINYFIKRYFCHFFTNQGFKELFSY